jgi:hypothetical protein
MLAFEIRRSAFRKSDFFFDCVSEARENGCTFHILGWMSFRRVREFHLFMPLMSIGLSLVKFPALKPSNLGPARKVAQD